jgi:hypothetical protein
LRRPDSEVPSRSKCAQTSDAPQRQGVNLLTPDSSVDGLSDERRTGTDMRRRQAAWRARAG